MHSKKSILREAPPMRPPYWMRTAAATSGLTFSDIHARMFAWVSWAISGVAVRPVPMAHTGS